MSRVLVTRQHDISLGVQEEVSVGDGFVWGDSATVPEDYDGPAMLPVATVDFTMPTALTTITVKSSGGDYTTLQSAWNALTSSGRANHTEIVVDAGYNPGSLTTGAQSGDDAYWCIIRSSASGSLPRHKRVGPSDKSNMFQLVVPVADRAVSMGANSRRVRFIGMSVEQDGSSYTGRECEMVDYTVSYVIVDRCLQLGSNTDRDCLRGWTLAGNHIGVIDSTIADIAYSGNDSQALWAYSGSGPYTFINCDLEASCENIMFGGANPSSNALVPRDITIERCYLHKDPAWQPDDPSVKNLLELKLGIRVLIQDCILDTTWLDGQYIAINFKCVNQGNTAPDGVCETGHVTMRWCRIYDAPEPIKFYGMLEGPGIRMHDVSVHDCLFYDMGTRSTFVSGGSNATAFSNIGGEIVFRNNTIIMEGGNIAVSLAGTPSANVTIRDNILPYFTYGIKGDSTGVGTPSLEAYCDTYYEGFNVFYGEGSPPSLSAYSEDDVAVASIAACGFESDAGKDYRLASGSSIKGTGTGGEDPGCDVATLNTRLTNVPSGDFSSDPWDT